MNRRCTTILSCTFLLTTSACAAGEGMIEVRSWGESFIEDGIPADEMADGWAISFDRFEVELRDISIAGATLDDPDPIDLSRPSDGEGQLLGTVDVAEGDYGDLSFTLARVTIEGSASKSGETKTFMWEFGTPVSYSECETLTQVPADGVGEVEITVHADHLFYDSLVAEEPALRFDAIAAADSDADGMITQEELAATDLGAYDPGNLSIDDLWSFLAAQAATMGHVDGEGHCVGTSD